MPARGCSCSWERWWRWLGIIPQFHHPLIGPGVGAAAEHRLALDHENDGIIRRDLQIEFPEFREQRPEAAVQPARELRLIRLLKLVKLPPGIIQVAERLVVVLFDFFPDAAAIHPHDGAAMVGRPGIGNGLAVGWRSGRAAWHDKSAAKYQLARTNASVASTENLPVN